MSKSSSLLGPLGCPVEYGEVAPNIFVIQASRLNALHDRTAKLNRRAAKIGGGVSVQVTEHFCQIWERDEWASMSPSYFTGRGQMVAVVRLGGIVPKVNGWALVAKVEHHGEIGNVISRAPGYEELPLPVELRTAPGSTCDHCNMNRRRNDTFVLLSPEGVQKRIGRNCLADFLRTEEVSAALSIWQFFYLLRAELSEYSDDGFGGGGGGSPVIGTRHFLACSVSAIRHHGWVSAKEARETSEKTATKTIASALAGPCPKGESRSSCEAREQWIAWQPTEADFAEADLVIEWAGALGERPELSEYLSNLRVAIAIGHVNYRSEGLVTSSVVAYRRENEQEVERHKRAAATPSTHFGEAKKRYTFETLEVVMVRFIEGNYGVTTLLVMVDPDGRRFKWFASGEKNFERGDVLTGKGTVKGHGEYKGSPETMLSRCDLTKKQTAAA